MKIRVFAVVCALMSLPLAAAESDGGISEKSFRCIRDMTPVRGFFVDNLNGDLEGTLAAANAQWQDRTTLYFRVGTAQGAAATADVYCWIQPLP